MSYRAGNVISKTSRWPLVATEVDIRTSLMERGGILLNKQSWSLCSVSFRAVEDKDIGPLVSDHGIRPYIYPHTSLYFMILHDEKEF